MKVSIQGIKGSFHHIASNKFFGKEAQIIERVSFAEIFEDLKNDNADFGIVAIENTIAGSILTNYDLLLKYSFSIVGEIYLRISHNLMGLRGQSISELIEIKSHPMALAQCEEFLKTLKVKVTEDFDTAGVARQISEEKLKGVGAVASSLAADLYGLEILNPAIETNKQNFTRFLIISKSKTKVENADKTSLAVELSDTPGSLFKFLQVFDSLGINITKIESRPIIGKPWSYRFYIDFELDAFSQKGSVLMDSLKDKCAELLILGSYKRGEFPQESK